MVGRGGHAAKDSSRKIKAANTRKTNEERIRVQVQMEDVGLCNDVQRGLQSPAYDTGR